MDDPALVARLLNVVEHEIAPLTEKGVAAGNKIFGAAVLRKSDLSTVLAQTNNETQNPLWHGEMHTLKLFYELPERPPTHELIFLSTHEPCSLCLSAITWAGFDNFYYLFSHEDSRDAFAIPHDLDILKEVFGLEPGGYRASNRYWTAYSIRKLIESLPLSQRSSLTQRVRDIEIRYAGLSAAYQSGKSGNEIPLR